MKTLLDHRGLDIVLRRLAHQLVEAHGDFHDTVLVGIQPRGVPLSDRLVRLLQEITGRDDLHYGTLDATFYRDDLRQGGGLHLPAATHFPFPIEGRAVVLVDDVLHTGRTVRAAMDALLDFGRPRLVELVTLIDRRFSRELPIQPDYTGRTVDTLFTQRVRVQWGTAAGDDAVLLVE